MTKLPLSRQTNIIVQEFENEVLIYDLTINKAFCLNQTSALVYQLCDGNNSVANISDLMSKKLKTLVSEDFVWLTISELKKDNLLENCDEVINHFDGMTRREIVKKVGLASMVMLPVIASIVAPSAATAQSSGLPLLSICSNNPQCLSGNCFHCSNCGISKVCCVPGGFFGSGDRVTDCDSASFCSAHIGDCCSGQAIFSPMTCIGTDGHCTCV